MNYVSQRFEGQILFLLFIYQNNIYQMHTHTQIYIRSDLLNLGTLKTYKHLVYCRTVQESEGL